MQSLKKLNYKKNSSEEICRSLMLENTAISSTPKYKLFLKTDKDKKPLSYLFLLAAVLDSLNYLADEKNAESFILPMIGNFSADFNFSFDSECLEGLCKLNVLEKVTNDYTAYYTDIPENIEKKYLKGSNMYIYHKKNGDEFFKELKFINYLIATANCV